MTLWAVVFYEIAFLAHALSHFLAARFTGMTVSAFALGFGPRMLSLTRENTRYTLNLIPLGASTIIDYSSGLSRDKAPLSKSLPVVAAGPLGNLVLAAALFSIFAMVSGTAVSLSAKIDTVVPNSPAAQAGLRSGDRILMIDEVPMNDGETILRTIRSSGGHTLSILVERDGVNRLFHVLPRYDAGRRMWLIGFSPVVVRTYWDIPRAVGFGITTTVHAIGAYFGIAASVLSRQPPNIVTGPPAMGILFAHGPGFGIFVGMALVSISIGLLNLLPIPPLDGWRALFILVGRQRRTG